MSLDALYRLVRKQNFTVLFNAFRTPEAPCYLKVSAADLQQFAQPE